MNGGPAPGTRAPLRLFTDEGEPEALQRRLFDIGIATIGLVVFSPLLALVALLIKLESPGPVFFKQKRAGKDGKPYEVYKFRSMRMAEAGEQIVPQVEDLGSFKFVPPNFKSRVTAVGRTIRTCSLDEMPEPAQRPQRRHAPGRTTAGRAGDGRQYRPEYHARIRSSLGSRAWHRLWAAMI